MKNPPFALTIGILLSLSRVLMADTGVSLHLTASGSNLTLFWQTSMPPFMLEFTPGLSFTNWTLTSNVIRTNDVIPTNGLFLANEVAANSAGFYRLRFSSTNPPAPAVLLDDLTVDPGRTFPFPMIFSDVTDDTGECDQNDDGRIICTAPLPINALDVNIFDASQMIDPRTGTNSSLSFHWEAFYPISQGGTLYTAAGISGYHSSVLTISSNSLPNLVQIDDDMTSVLWRIRLTVSSRPLPPYDGNAYTNIYWFRFKYVGSLVSMDMSGQCQNCTNLPCGSCAFSNALAPTETP